MHDTADPVANLQILVRCPSVTPADGGALPALGKMLEALGFAVDPVRFSENGTPDVANLYARRGQSGRHLMFAGHTDVVPAGDEGAWSQPPFGGAIVDGQLIGRGAVDMKGAIACFVAAVSRLSPGGSLDGSSVSLLITGDEEGPSINGTRKLVEWAAARGERWDGAVVGEPTNQNELGDMIKIGRRGSVSGVITVNGVQGHVAYPHLADNAIPSMLHLLGALLARPLDEGTQRFPATNLEITSIDVGNPATNVIPARATAAFNIRFSDLWDVEGLQAEIRKRLERAAAGSPFREGRPAIDFDLAWRDRPSPAFLTHDRRLIEIVAGAVEAVTGRRPELSTTGGTSDARFIKDYCPVVEFGLVGQTMHMVDERVPLADLEMLTRIYCKLLESWVA